MRKIFAGVIIAIALVALTAAATRINLSTQSIVGGTNYGVVYQNASGVPQTTVAGASGNVLTSTATGAPVYLPAVGATLSANQTFTGINTFSNASSTFAGNAATATTATNLLGGTVQATQLGFQTGAGVGTSLSGSSIPLVAATNNLVGNIVLSTVTLVAGITEIAAITSSKVGPDDIILVSGYVIGSGGYVGYDQFWASNPTGSTFYIFISSPGFTNQTINLNYVVIKGTAN